MEKHRCSSEINAILTACRDSKSLKQLPPPPPDFTGHIIYLVSAPHSQPCGWEIKSQRGGKGMWEETLCLRQWPCRFLIHHCQDSSKKRKAAHEVMLPNSVTILKTSSEALQLTGVTILQLLTAQEKNSIPKASSHKSLQPKIPNLCWYQTGKTCHLSVASLKPERITRRSP